MKFGAKLLILTGAWFFLSSAEAMNTKIVNVYGVHKYSMHHNTVAGTNYVIEAGVFSYKVYADQYKKYLSTKTNKPIRVEKSKNRYYVYVGPFNDIRTMDRVSQELIKKEKKHSLLQAMHSALKPLSPIMPVQKTEVIKTEAKKEQSIFAPFKRMLPDTTSPVVRKPVANSVTKPYTISSKTMEKVPNKYGKYSNNPKKTTAVWKDMEQNHSLKSGPYVGASIGPQFNISGLPTTYDALEGTISAGWAQIFTNRLYLAGEIFGSDGKKLKSYPASASGYTIQSNWSAGADVLPGYMIMDYVLGYLRLGWVQTDFNLTATTQGQQTFAATSNKGGISNPRHVNLNAWQVGFGGEVNIYKNLDIRAEYIFSLYNSAILINKPQVNQVNLGLLYRFADH